MARNFVQYGPMASPRPVPARRLSLRAFPPLLPALALLLSGCVYFNTYYNAQKAYDQAIRLREKRLEKTPDDSVLVTNEEKLKLERSIAKSSKVLELYPDKKKYQPKALFLIGEAYLAMGEYARAILKYDELKRFYPQAEEMLALRLVATQHAAELSEAQMALYRWRKESGHDAL